MQKLTILMFSVCSKQTMHQMLSIYAKLFSHLLAVRKRECGFTHPRNCHYHSQIEIVPTIKEQNHIQCQCADEFSVATVLDFIQTVGIFDP